MSCISLTLQMSMNSCRPLLDDVDSTVEALEGDRSGSSSVSSGAPELKFDLTAGTLLTEGVLGARRGRAKFDPPKPESDLAFDPPPFDPLPFDPPPKSG